ncbi:hypothetical protein N7491_003668 [Penicillium cf. griseofulvum]|nr:hypothetical protein N7491_003668 [Penicillium cf. griseofulvum]
MGKYEGKLPLTVFQILHIHVGVEPERQQTACGGVSYRFGCTEDKVTNQHTNSSAADSAFQLLFMEQMRSARPLEPGVIEVDPLMRGPVKKQSWNYSLARGNLAGRFTLVFPQVGAAPHEKLREMIMTLSGSKHVHRIPSNVHLVKWIGFITPPQRL